MNRVMRFWRSDAGASSAEYALLLGIVGTAIVAAAIGLGGAIANSMNDTAQCIETEGGTCTR